jgi:hypothetical protein
VTLELLPLDLDEANALVEKWHRHHDPVTGHKFSLGAWCEEKGFVGCAIVSRPVARMLQDGLTLEVNRVSTDGTHNACSFLYGAARRATFALGYKKLITYTLPEEGGSSLRAAGWKCIGEAGGGKWSRKLRPRVDTHPEQKKLRWEVEVSE